VAGFEPIIFCSLGGCDATEPGHLGQKAFSFSKFKICTLPSSGPEISRLLISHKVTQMSIEKKTWTKTMNFNGKSFAVFSSPSSANISNISFSIR
jgi:hypothetical protein